MVPGPSLEFERAFTLVDLLIAIVLIAIVTAVALPSFSAYLVRGRLAQVPPAITSTIGLIEQAHLKLRSYDDGTGRCAISFVDHPPPKHFSFQCDLSAGGKGFRLTATSLATIAGSAQAGDYVYTVNHMGEKTTVSFAGQKHTDACWIVREGEEC